MNHRRQRPRLRRLAGGAAWIVLAGCGDGTPDRSATQAPPSARADAAPQTAPEMPTQTAADIAPDARSPSASPTAFALVDATDELGIDVRYRSRPAGDHHLAAIMGGGVAAFDANGDGRIDLYFTNGHDGTDASPYRDRLLVQRADGTFEDATDAAGLGHRGFGMGVAVGDVDNDGDLDLFVANVGPDVLYRNEGGGRFTDATDAAGVGGGEAWSASATFLDYDGDGFLDLYVCRYLAFDPARACFDNLGRPEFCGPSTFPALPDRLYRNRGDGTFEDASAASGIAAEAFAGLGVVAADLDDDGRMDLFVANDRHPNLLWRNLGDGTFAEEAMLSGSAFNADGRAEAGMGVAAGDPDEDGDLDLFLTHLTSESNTLYRSDGAAGFVDATSTAGLALPSMAWTGWGTGFADLDHDGDLDLAVANGAVLRRADDRRPDLAFWGAYAEPNHLYANDGTGRFVEVPDEAAGDFARDVAVSRGLLPVDLDADGDLDLVVVNIEDRVRVYRNETDASRGATVRLVDPALRREALGAKATFRLEGRTIVRHAIPPGSYLAAAEATIHFALPARAVVLDATVRWPDGTLERFDGFGPGRTELRRGEGRRSP